MDLVERYREAYVDLCLVMAPNKDRDELRKNLLGSEKKVRRDLRAFYEGEIIF